MDDVEQVKSYVEAYAWGGPTSALQLSHLRQLSYLIRPGDIVLDLACGPGPLLLELAALYPDATFIGADLAETMLKHLREEAVQRGLSNITTLQEDIRTLPSLRDRQIDLVISTSALHHLPDESCLREVFKRVQSLIKPEGAFYFFDFGLLKSAETRKILVAEVAKSAPPLTARDYDLSLQAAFPIEFIFEAAREFLPKPFVEKTSAFVDFFYFLHSQGTRTSPSRNVQLYIDQLWRSLSPALKVEYLMLRGFSKRCVVS